MLGAPCIPAPLAPGRCIPESCGESGAARPGAAAGRSLSGTERNGTERGERPVPHRVMREQRSASSTGTDNGTAPGPAEATLRF